jgi:hypothetical protein
VIPGEHVVGVMGLFQKLAGEGGGFVEAEAGFQIG